MPPNSFAEVDSDPICSSAGCNYKKKKGEAGDDVFYRDGGPLDKDIVDSKTNLENTETLHGHVFMPTASLAEMKAPAKKKAAPAKKDSGKKSYHEHSKAHFKNNYKNSAAKRKARNLLKESMSTNWGTFKH